MWASCAAAESRRKSAGVYHGILGGWGRLPAVFLYSIFVTDLDDKETIEARPDKAAIWGPALRYVVGDRGIPWDSKKEHLFILSPA